MKRLVLATALNAALGMTACAGEAKVATSGIVGTVDVETRATEVLVAAPPPPSADPIVAPIATASACPRQRPLELEHAATPADADLVHMLTDARLRFGSASIGGPARGALYGAIELEESDAIAHAGGYAWGTANAVHAIERAVRQVRECFPGTPRLFVGDLSRERGGFLGPHASHQAGLDADIGWFYVTPPLWYVRATAKNLDVPRTRQMLIALVEGGNVEMIFIDRGVQALLRRQKDEAPGPDVPPDDWFESPLHRDALIRHAWGHATHFHVRFIDPDASALGARLAGLLPPTHPLRRLALAAKR